MKKTALILAVSLLLTSLIGCDKSGSKGGRDSKADFTKEDGEIYADVPVRDWKGTKFVILNANTDSPASKLTMEETDGNNLNDAVFRRTTNVESRLNITVEEIRDSDENIYDRTVQSCLANEAAYDAVCMSAGRMSILAVNGYLADSDRLSGLDLSKPWWNSNITDEANVDDVNYYFFGDMQLSLFDAHSIVGVNMDMASSISSMEDPYELVKSGRWTIDKMLEMASMAASDIDGNGEVTADDRFGISLDAASLLPAVYGCGARLSRTDEYGLPELVYPQNETFYDVFTKISDSLFSGSAAVYDPEKVNGDTVSTATQFSRGGSLFLITDVGNLYSLRSMEYEFGVLPMPKYSEMQEDYISLIPAESVTAVGVPITAKGFSFSGAVLENIAAESHRAGGVTQCYIDSVLSFRYVNDEESRENLTNILNSGTLDAADIYNWGGICDTLSALASRTDVYSSTLDRIERDVRSELTDTVTQINKNRMK